MIRGEVHWLWRAVDQREVVLDEILQRRRDQRAAKRLPISLLKRQGRAPQRIVTDKLASYCAVKREMAPGRKHRSHKGSNNRAENSHVPLRKRERQMQGFRSAGGLQRFTSVFSAVRSSSSRPQQTPRILHPSPPARRLRPLAQRRLPRARGLKQAGLGLIACRAS